MLICFGVFILRTVLRREDICGYGAARLNLELVMVIFRGVEGLELLEPFEGILGCLDF